MRNRVPARAIRARSTAYTVAGAIDCRHRLRPAEMLNWVVPWTRIGRSPRNCASRFGHVSGQALI